MNDFTVVQKIALWAIPLIFAITAHEVAHGWIASKFGDQTARLQGRLTLNPIKHIDLVGTIIVPFLMIMIGGFVFGWAKPVPVDSRNLKNPRYNMIFVALAGPMANFVMAIFWACIAKFGYSMGSSWFGVPLALMGQIGIMINIVLGVLNCLPIPPLDGGRVLENLLPPRMGYKVSRLEPYGFFILILLMITGVLGVIVGPPVFFLQGLIMSMFGL